MRANVKRLVTAIAVFLLGQALLSGQVPGGVKVAEGEYLYEMDGKAVLSQKWVLYRLENGGFKEVDNWETQAAGKPPMTFQTSLTLGTDLRPLSLEGMPSPKKDVGETKCRFASKKLRCEWPSEKKKLEFPAREPYDVLSLHPWFFSGMARRAERGRSEARSLHLFQIVDGSWGYPLSFMVREGEVQWVGNQEVDVSGNKLSAERYELSLEPLRMVFWVSTEGVLLAMEDDSSSKNRIKLVRFEKYSEFGPKK